MAERMRTLWRAEKHRLGWAIVCDAPLGMVLEMGLPDELDDPVGDWIFNTRHAAEQLARLLNDMEDEVARQARH